ncbi:hypothetical protein [Actinomadura macrotermitis]|nr:hypothetical protein [Actinomadura macrotermitis]
MTGLGRRGVLALGAVLVLAACTSTEKSTEKPEAVKLRTDLAPLKGWFGGLGPMTGAHWLPKRLGADRPKSRVTIPGPTDFHMVGTVRLKAGTVAAITAAPRWHFRPEAPAEPTPELAAFMPGNAKWVRSRDFDDHLAAGSYQGAFHLDPRTDTVYFDIPEPLATTEP